MTPIEEKMRKSRLRWYVHVQSRPTDAPVRRCKIMKKMHIKRRREISKKKREERQ